MRELFNINTISNYYNTFKYTRYLILLFTQSKENSLSFELGRLKYYVYQDYIS